MQMQESQIDVNKATAEKLRADAANAGANTETTNASRATIIENLQQSGEAQWLENIKTRFLMENNPREPQDEWQMNRNPIYKVSVGIQAAGGFAQEASANILKTLSDAGNATAQELLTNKKAEGYMTELNNAVIQANAAAKNALTNEQLAENDKIKALAQKISAEFQAGELMNTKQIIQLSTTVLQGLASGMTLIPK